MVRPLILVSALIAMMGMLTSCSSDTVDGNTSYFTNNEMIATLEGGDQALHLMDNGGGTLMVTYGRSFPLHLNAEQKAELTTYSGNLEIPAQVAINGKTYSITAIDAMAFSNCKTLKTVSIPETVTKFGEGAFVNCTALTSVNIPNAVTEIPSALFGQCKSVTKFVLPDGVKTIGTLAFANCSKASTITLNEGLTEISDRAFLRCSGLRELTIPSTVTTIGPAAFLTASKLTKLHVKSTTPPVVADSLMETSYIKKSTLYVPKGSAEAYKADASWNQFKSITEE